MNGAAVARALARRGAAVVGIDRHTPPHTLGSSHGVTRILRFAYFEDPRYVPLVRAAHAGWLKLERDTGRSLFRRTGALSLGPADGVLVSGVEASVREHGLAHERLDGAAVEQRFPGLRTLPGEMAVYEPDAGLLAAEECVSALLADAVAAGAELRTGQGGVSGWEEAADGVRVRTEAGELEVDALVLALGPWLAQTDAGRALGLVVERQAFFWYEHDAGALPVTLRELGDGRMVYMAPGPGPKLKIALHHDGEACDPESVRREAGPADEARVRPLLRDLLPGAAGRPALEGSVCLYTNAPDHHFIVDRLPGHDRVHVASACSGHGFKFAPAIGAAVADAVLDGRAATELALFGTARLAGP